MNGFVTQIIGPVVDVEFPRDSMPKVFDALKIDSKDANAKTAHLINRVLGSAASLASP